jgi:N utilization substance protein A
MDFSALKRIINQIAEERGIPPLKAQEAIEGALATAYKKEYGTKSQIIRAKIDMEKEKIRFWQVKLVVDKSMIYSEEELKKLKGKEEKVQDQKKIKFNPQRHILLEEARKINPKIKPGEELEFELEPKEIYGRIATQAAKQVILQRLKEVERETVYEEYQGKVGGIVSGIIQRIEKNNIYVDLGKTVAILPKNEQVKGEFYRPGQRMKFYLLNVEKTQKGPVIFLSRAHPKLVSKLFELEVPEISSGLVQIKSIAREPGFRTKIAVSSTQEGLDPIGALVGQRGTRIMAVINELGGEKIDVIEYSDDPQKYIANSLAPAKVLEVRIGKKNTAVAIVNPDQLSLAIGKDGRNVRLAANLTNWKIDVRTTEEAEKEKEKEKKKTK